MLHKEGLAHLGPSTPSKAHEHARAGVGAGTSKLPQPVAPEQLAWRCDPTSLNFECTDEVPPLEGLVGQDRALEALELGLELGGPGYNVYVVGPSGSGRMTTVRQEVAQAAAQRLTPGDWCYIYNFRVPYQPLAAQLPSGQGPQFARDVRDLVQSFQRDMPKVFESDPYQRRRSVIIQATTARHDALLAQLAAFANGLGFTLQTAPGQLMGIPLKESGEPMTPEEFEHLTPELKADFQQRNRQLQQEVEKTFTALHQLDRDTQQQIEALNREFAEAEVGHRFGALRIKYTENRVIQEYLEAVRSHLIEHLEVLREQPENERPGEEAGSMDPHYAVNVLVGSSPDSGAPVVFEPNPTYYNLLGRVDYRFGAGSMSTDLTLIKPGALHRANRGYLIVQARDLLLSPFSWEALKRALRDAEVRVENLGDQLSAFPTTTLRPEPIPLAVKVVLIGDLRTYMILFQLDEDFAGLFKVKAQFTPLMDRTPDSIGSICRFVSSQVKEQGLPPFSREAVARVVEYASRLAEDQDRLATRFDALGEVVAEAAFRARRESVERVTATHVEEALAAQERRLSLSEDELRRLVVEGTYKIDTTGEEIGQINGLSIIDMGDYAFGHPSRITASVGTGSEGVVNIEREAHLSGPTHSKGILILGGYLRDKYAGTAPLALSASLAFEQTYSMIDGDSASAAELYTLLSALSGLPIHQGIAVTGSINQRGEIQAIGGVTRKIEGYFAVCKEQGLTGKQGVMIPASNVRHLSLKQEVVDAVAAGRFHIWAAATIDGGIELLTGVAAGERGADGLYPEGSVHALVQKRLGQMASALRRAGRATSPLQPAATANGATRHAI
ncbi:MAG TPA: ATP-binding protein [Chloroflexota bacterium]